MNAKDEVYWMNLIETSGLMLKCKKFSREASCDAGVSCKCPTFDFVVEFHSATSILKIKNV